MHALLLSIIDKTTYAALDKTYSEVCSFHSFVSGRGGRKHNTVSQKMDKAE